MDSQRITAIALGVCWLAGIAGAFMLKGTYNDVQSLKPRMSVAESKQIEFERRIENEQEKHCKLSENDAGAVKRATENICKP